MFTPPPLWSYNAGVIGHRRARKDAPPYPPAGPGTWPRRGAGRSLASSPGGRAALHRPAPRLRRRLAPSCAPRRLLRRVMRKTKQARPPAAAPLAAERKKEPYGPSSFSPFFSPFFVSRFTPPEERSAPRPRDAPPRPAARPREQRSDRPAVPSREDAPGTTPGT